MDRKFYRAKIVVAIRAMLSTVFLSGIASICLGNPPDYFAIQVIDDQSNRPVPLVELSTVNSIRHYTDSNGLVAFLEPGLMNRRVWFNVKSHGYEYPADGFGNRGVALDTTPGGSATIKIHRVNIAERMYRLTGEGIYNDSVLLGKPTPMDKPVLNARVLGQDSAVAVAYDGKAYWFWGDTSKDSYPLGHFGTAGAVANLATLDPERAINFEYFTDSEGFSAPTFQWKIPGAIWIGGAVVVKDAKGVDNLVTYYSRQKDLGTQLEQGLAKFDFESHTFSKIKQLDPAERMHPNGQAFRVTAGGTEYFYFSMPYGLLRVKATYEDVIDPTKYEGYSCLVAGTKYLGEKSQLDRDSNGKLVFAWKRNTPPVAGGEQEELIKAGVMKAAEAQLQPRDVETNEAIQLHGGSVNWNAYRKRYVMIAVQIKGKTSLLGEVWYLEADKPEGPWLRARKIVTHDKYTFYNPVHHDFLDRENGRVIYFEGTYTNTFSGVVEATPRYEYNQVLYRLDLTDSRLQAVHDQPNKAR